MRNVSISGQQVAHNARKVINQNRNRTENPTAAVRMPLVSTRNQLARLLRNHISCGKSPAKESTRQSARVRRIPGKFLDFITDFKENTVGECFAGSADSQTTDNLVMAIALNVEAFVEDLLSTIDDLRKRDDWCHWKIAINSEPESLCKNNSYRNRQKNTLWITSGCLR